MNITEEIINVMDSNGIEYIDGKIVSEINSLQFVSVLIELEASFGIEIPEEMIKYDVLNNLDVLAKNIQRLLHG